MPIQRMTARQLIIVAVALIAIAFYVLPVENIFAAKHSDSTSTTSSKYKHPKEGSPTTTTSSGSIKSGSIKSGSTDTGSIKSGSTDTGSIKSGSTDTGSLKKLSRSKSG